MVSYSKAAMERAMKVQEVILRAIVPLENLKWTSVRRSLQVSVSNLVVRSQEILGSERRSGSVPLENLKWTSVHRCLQ